MNALKQLGTSKTMNKDFRPLKFLFSQSKNRDIPVPVFLFCLSRLSYYRICAFLWTQTRDEGFISWSKTFSCGTTAGNHELARFAHLARS